MAEKGFGAKEINLIGSSGTPTIESPGNLNLNANNVAISTNVSIGGTLTVSGNVSVGGTLTYEDVTNIDSVGVVTAREGIIIPDNKALSLGNRLVGSTAGDLRLYHDTNNSYIDEIGSGNLYIRNGSNNSIYCQTSGTVQLFYNGNDKLATTNTGVSVSGTLAATTFSGSGASLTNLPAANLTGTLPAISGANLTGIAVTEAPAVDFTITGDGSNYYFHGGGVDGSAGDPDLYLIRGQKYRFNNTTGTGHPFRFTSTGNANAAYSKGVTGSESGVQFWTIPYDAPAKLFYVCTIHGGMVGNIYIRGANGQNDNVGVTTFSGAVRQTGNPVFIAYRTSTYSLGTSEIEMVYNNERIDVGSNYNTSNGRFTAPVTGLYEFAYASIAHNNNTVYRYDLRINGSRPYSPLRLELRIDQGGNWNSSSNANSEYGTNGEYVCYVNMTAGQYASVYATADTSTTCYGDSNYGYTYFRGRLVG